MGSDATTYEAAAIRRRMLRLAFVPVVGFVALAIRSRGALVSFAPLLGVLVPAPLFWTLLSIRRLPKPAPASVEQAVSLVGIRTSDLVAFLLAAAIGVAAVMAIVWGVGLSTSAIFVAGAIGLPIELLVTTMAAGLLASNRLIRAYKAFVVEGGGDIASQERMRVLHMMLMMPRVWWPAPTQTAPWMTTYDLIKQAEHAPTPDRCGLMRAAFVAEPMGLPVPV